MTRHDRRPGPTTLTASLTGRWLLNAEPADGCWTWKGTHNEDGYGYLDQTPAHRYGYVLFNGQVPAGLVIDHLCRNRACVNPAHLEAVTNRVNLLRGETIPARNAAKTHCPQDHEYTPENTEVENGKRRCKTCRRERQLARYHARKAA